MNADSALDAQLRFSRLLPDFDAWLRRYEQWSRQWRSTNEPLVLPTGSQPRQEVRRLCDGRPERRVAIVFVHGGYWRAFAAADHDFVARGLGTDGHPVWSVEYRLLPAVRMGQQIDDVTHAIRLCLRTLDAAGREPRVLLVGHSAGAHLAMCAAAQLPPARVHGVVAISGLYDLMPVAQSFLQAELDLRTDEIAEHSPLRWTASPTVPHLIAVGAAETAHFLDQARALQAHRAAGGARTDTLVLPGLHHMATEAELHDPDSALTRRIRHLALTGC